LGKDEVYVQRVVRSLHTDERVTKFRLNRDAASLAITYEPKDVPLSHWAELLQSAELTGQEDKGTRGQFNSKFKIQNSKFKIQNPKSKIPQLPTPDKQEESEDSLPFESIAILPTPSATEAAGVWTQLKPPALSMSLEFMARFPLQTATK
jgi:hypothetical protein